VTDPALLRAIIDHPDEDTPRLMFADWLDEHADALPRPNTAHSRAQFIRDDIALSQLDAFDPLRLRWELIDKPRRESEPWASAALPPVPERAEFDRGPLFRRGFAWSVALDGRYHALPEPPADSVPLERVRYCFCGPRYIDQLRTAPWRSRLSELEFERRQTYRMYPRRLLELDGLDRLSRLSFGADAIEAAEARALIAAPMFGQLSALAIVRTSIGAAVLESLASTPHRLRALRLSNCRVTPAALETLLRSPAANQLEALAVGGDRIGAPEKFRVFGRAPAPPALHTLDMSDDSPKETGLEALLASPLVPGLRKLALAYCNLNTDRTRLLASGAFTNLRVLDLARNLIGNEGAVALARAPHLAGLLVLNLSYARVGDEGIVALLESPLVDRLVLLDLTGSPASEEAKELLVGQMGDRVRV
jgi:uncharacterized protein (TIGR02996 family)